MYVYFRALADDRVMVVANNNNRTESIDLSRFAAQMGGARVLREMRTHSEIPLGSNALVELGPFETGLYELVTR